MNTLEMIKEITEDKTKEFEATLSSGRKGNVIFKEIGLVWGTSGRLFQIDNNTLRLTWTEAKKPVPFLKAIEAHNGRKKIKCVRTHMVTTYSSFGPLTDQNGEAICCDEILFGKWYIEEE